MVIILFLPMMVELLLLKEMNKFELAGEKMQFLLNDKKIYTGQTFTEIENLLHEYGLNTTIPEESQVIILHGKLSLKEVNHDAVIHIYFGKEKEELQSMVMHPIPMNFEKIQRFLENHLGKPDIASGENNVIWKFADGEVIHQIVDRFGEEEMVYINFGNRI